MNPARGHKKCNVPIIGPIFIAALRLTQPIPSMRTLPAAAPPKPPPTAMRGRTLPRRPILASEGTFATAVPGASVGSCLPSLSGAGWGPEGVDACPRARGKREKLGKRSGSAERASLFLLPPFPPFDFPPFPPLLPPPLPPFGPGPLCFLLGEGGGDSSSLGQSQP